MKQKKIKIKPMINLNYDIDLNWRFYSKTELCENDVGRLRTDCWSLRLQENEVLQLWRLFFVKVIFVVCVWKP